MPYVIINSPLGALKLCSSDEALVEVSFTTDEIPESTDLEANDILKQAIRQLNEYFASKRTTFDLPLAPKGTNFQKRVWNLVQNIPFGQTTTYGSLSEKLGDRKAVRAVGSANGRNPIPIIIPCHRVLGNGQTLTGYSGGIERKRWLLQHEGSLLL